MPAAAGAGWIIVRLDEVLEERGMTLTELASRIGLTQANVSILKTGKAKAIRFSTLSAICEALECQPGDLLSFSPTGEGGARGCTVVLDDPGSRPIAVVKQIRELTGAGLKEAKGLTENTPSVVSSQLSRLEAETMMVALRQAGATVAIT